MRASKYKRHAKRLGSSFTSKDVVAVPTKEITIVNDDVLAGVKLSVENQIERGRYKSKKAWARDVLGSARAWPEPVELYLQDDGELYLLDGNHRYYAATILSVPLPSYIIV